MQEIQNSLNNFGLLICTTAQKFPGQWTEMRTNPCFLHTEQIITYQQNYVVQNYANIS